LISETRGTTFETQSNETGDFVFSSVPGDTYTVRVSMDGPSRGSRSRTCRFRCASSDSSPRSRLASSAPAPTGSRASTAPGRTTCSTASRRSTPAATSPDSS
jgi:hypothetical protein